MSLTLKKGKFYQDGQLVPLEFGNKEQIELMEKENRIECAFLDKKNHVNVEIGKVFTANAEFKCSCGVTVYFEADSKYDEWSAKAELEGSESKCHRCNSRYSIHRKEKQFFIAKVSKGKEVIHG